MIPKIIWQTHDYTINEDMPEQLKNSIDFFKRHFETKGWEYRYLDRVRRKEIIKENKTLYKIYLEVDKIFRSAEFRRSNSLVEVNVCGKWREYGYAKGMFRGDILKLVVMYEFGGVFLDSDMVLTKKSLDLLTNTDYDLYASVHAKTCSHCFKPLRESINSYSQSTGLIYPYKNCGYSETNKNFFNNYGIDAIAAKPKLDIFKDIIDQILDIDSIAFFQQFYTENIYKYKSASEGRINEELDAMDFATIDYPYLPEMSSRYEDLRREEEIICPCQNQL